jgi:hypothetical protein
MLSSTSRKNGPISLWKKSRKLELSKATLPSNSNQTNFLEWRQKSHKIFWTAIPFLGLGYAITSVWELKNLSHFQAALICSTFFIQNFCWTYLPFMTSGFSFGGELIFFAIMLSSILLYSVDAIVVLIFNSMVRRVAMSFFKTETNLAFTSQYRRSIVTSNTDPERRTSVSPLAK